MYNQGTKSLQALEYQETPGLKQLDRNTKEPQNLPQPYFLSNKLIKKGFVQIFAT